MRMFIACNALCSSNVAGLLSFADLAALTWYVCPASGSFYILSDSKQFLDC